MEFNKAYNRRTFTQFLQYEFLPSDYTPCVQEIEFSVQTKYATSATLLGKSESLDLAVYEIRHTSRHDARVSLSKEAFRILADEYAQKALVAFVPEDNCANYRFSLIEMTLAWEDSKLTRNYSNPRRYSYYLGEGIAYYTPNKFLNSGKAIDDKDLHARFSVEVLTKQFYTELSNWYAWAIREMCFPNKLDDSADNAKYNNESAIRMITRLIFVWFLKQQGLIPNEFFDEEYLAQKLLKDFAPNTHQDGYLNIHPNIGKSTESKYYKAILQNLFFAMLNSPITDENGNMMRRFSKESSGDYGNSKLMRYQKYFKDPQLFLDLANQTVPFLNGGLFDCLDDKDAKIFYDGFSDNDKIQKALFVPDYMFFGEERTVDLSDYYGANDYRQVSARGIIDILKRYNFTVEENTPFDKEVSLDPELLGKVFENLLAAYNPETESTARNATGSFYTPREIVQYMVDESIITHLKRTVSEDLEPEFRKMLAYNDEQLNFTDEKRKAIISSLYDCKILDPACGSGAFPVGALQQMVHILNRIDDSNAIWHEMMLKQAIKETSDAYYEASDAERKELIADIERSFDENINRPDYARKLYLTENCIYGADIQPIAIQISKLRFFISLVVDQKINSDPADNFGIRPLPNLEAKFVAANSLIGLSKEITLAETETVRNFKEQLKTANHKIFSAKTIATKRKYKEILKETRIALANELKMTGFVDASEANMLAAWDMFDQNSVSPFFDPDWMFGVNNGFDVIIGNPPYIQLQKNGGELAELYKNCKFVSFTRSGDIYCLFYERGLQLLKEGGHLCFITSNKWMRAGYGEATRKFLAEKTNPKILIDFAGQKIFESATVDTNILLFQKTPNTKKTTACVAKPGCRENLSGFIRQHSTTSTFNTSDSWVILNPIEQSIKDKIERIGKPLKEWDIKINYGIKTGCNEAFIIDAAKRDEILENCASADERKRTDELIRPILRGRDIKRYGYEWANLYLIASHNGIPDKKIPRINIDDYPAVKRHLNLYWSQISKRSDMGDTPYNLRSCAYMGDFSKPKIVYREISDTMNACMVEPGIFINNKCYMLTGEKLGFLLGVLNSTVFNKFLLQAANLTGGKGSEFLEKIYFPTNATLHIEIDELISSEKYNEIDMALGKFYNLTNAENDYLKKLSLFD